MAEEVLAIGNARRNSEGHFAFVGDHAVHAPGLGGNIKTILINLEPLQTSDVRLRRVRNLGPIINS